jgi:hypothetical protein
MTWRVCSPPWPGRRNPGSWPGRRLCGLPSAGPPLRWASHPLPGGPRGTDGPGGLGRPVPEPGWPRCWSQQWPGWAASLRPTRTCCPAPFSNWPTSRWRRRPRIALARCQRPIRRERDTRGPPRSGRPAGRPRDLTIRRAPLSALADGQPRGRTPRRPCGYRPVRALPNLPAVPARRTGQARRRRHRTVPARRQPGPPAQYARAPSRGPRASPPCTRPFPDGHRPVRPGA